MAADDSLSVRRALLAEMKGDAALTDLVLAANIHPQSPLSKPSWPFVKYGSPAPLPLRASCVDGSTTRVAIHGFAKARYDGGAMIETAEDHAARIGAAMASALDLKRLTLEGGGTAHVIWEGSQLFQDGAEADAYHTVQRFRVRVIA